MVIKALKFLLIVILVTSYGCSSDENSTEETSINPHDQNSAKIVFDGVEIPNDGISSIHVSATKCCDKDIELWFDITEPYLGELLSLKLSKDGELLRYRFTNTFFEENRGTYFNPYFYIPDDFVEITTFNFDAQQNSLDLKAKVKLLKQGTHISENELLEIDTEFEVRYFSPCNCTETIESVINLTPEIQFTDISKSSSPSNNSNFEYYSSDLSSGFYIELDNLNSFLGDYPLGVYTFNSDDSAPKLSFKKYIGQPQTITNRFFNDDDWVNYDIEGQLEILEKLDNGLTRSNISFTASHEGAIIFEFTNIEIIL